MNSVIDNAMLLFLIALAAFCATMIGGLIALKLKDKLHLILGFSAGAVIGVALFDLLPQAIAFGTKYHSPAMLTLFVAIGFTFYLLLDRVASFHGNAPGVECAHGHTHAPTIRASLGAGSMSLHSFFDGITIGLAFDVSASVGVIMTIAVLTHDFSDGMNTMNMVLKNGGTRRAGLRWLFVDALAPAAGIAAASLITITEPQFGLALSLFAGLFLYIGASDLIPESFHSHPKALTTVTTVLGMAVIYLAVIFAG
ncbi:MAG: ZIP family metal transporter [Pseudomonadota bacterium]